MNLMITVERPYNKALKRNLPGGKSAWPKSLSGSFLQSSTAASGRYANLFIATQSGSTPIRNADAQHGGLSGPMG